MLVPELSAGAADELGDLRAACDAVVKTVVDAAPDVLLLVGDGPGSLGYSWPFVISFAPWGNTRTTPIAAAGRVTDTPPAVPLSLLVGGWLLQRGLRDGAGTTVVPYAVGAATPAPDCAALGARLVSGLSGDRRDPPGGAAGVAGMQSGSRGDAARREARIALLVSGDGSACRGRTDPMPHDPRGAEFDAGVARALATVDPDALLGLDAERAARLGVAGRAPWQVLAGAVRADGGRWTGALHYDAAPYGVGYLVAAWTRR